MEKQAKDVKSEIMEEEVTVSKMFNPSYNQRNTNWNSNEAFCHYCNNGKTFHANKEIPFQTDKI